MNRRDFLRTAGGSAAAVAAGAGVASGQEGTATGTPGGTANGTANGTSNGTAAGTGTASGGGGGGGGPTKNVTVAPGGSLSFEPAEIEIAPGTTVKWTWEGDGHNVVVGDQPEGANWSGTKGGASKLYDTGHTYSHTFQTKGTYEYWCQPHKTAGMVGSVKVVENPSSGGGGGGGKKELHDYGVPIQAHWVGAAAVLMTIVSMVFTFYVLKYGESPNTGNTGGGED